MHVTHSSRVCRCELGNGKEGRRAGDTLCLGRVPPFLVVIKQEMADGGTANGESTSDPRRLQTCKRATSMRAVGCVYMLAFNLVCTYAWGKVFAAMLSHILHHSLPGVLHVSAWPEIERPLFFAQSLAVLEIVHALLGKAALKILLIRRKDECARINCSTVATSSPGR